MVVIGIDPDLDKNGVAVVVDGQLKELHGLTFYQLTRLISRMKDKVRFVLEEVEADKTVYVRPGTSRKQMLKIAQNVGQVKGVCRLIGQYLEQCGADYVMVKPLKGRAKKAKNDATFFNQITGWTGRSNQDKRDAALLALSVT